MSAFTESTREENTTLQGLLGKRRIPHTNGLPTTLNCIGPLQQPKLLTPERPPGAAERPWFVSTLPIAARYSQPTVAPAAW